MLLEIEKELYRLNKELARLKQEYNQQVIEIETQIEKNEKDKLILMTGYDLESIEQAKQVMYFSNLDNIKAEYYKQQYIETLDAVRNDVIKDYKFLSKHYFGVNLYSGFGYQIENHEYGMGPRHGSIQYSIGLQPEYRGNNIELISVKQSNAILYVINMLRSNDTFRQIVFPKIERR